MAKIVNQPSLGTLLGTGVGQGLGQGLQELAQNKLQQLAQRQLIPALAQQKFEQPGQQPAAAYQQSLNALLNPQPASSEEFKVPEGLSERQSTKLADLALREKSQKQKAESKEQERIDKLTQPFYTQTLEKASAGKKANQRLDRMKQLIDQGNLPTPTFYNLMTGLSEFGSGIPIVGGIFNVPGKLFGGLLRASQDGTTLRDQEEFEKLSNDFVREAKSIYGSRLTNADLANFMKLIPTLSQTDSGKLSIIRNLENMYKADQVKAKALKQVIEENKGKRPHDLEFKVEKKAKKKLDALAKKFVSGVPSRGEAQRKITPEKDIREQNREVLDKALSSLGSTLSSLFR